MCRSKKCCPKNPSRTRFGCCNLGERVICCPDLISCCPVGFICDDRRQLCIRRGYSSVLQVQAIPLGKIIDKGCREGTAGMDPKVKSYTFTTGRTSVKENWCHRHLWRRFLPWRKTSVCRWNNHLWVISWNIWLLSHWKCKVNKNNGHHSTTTFVREYVIF